MMRWRSAWKRHVAPLVAIVVQLACFGAIWGIGSWVAWDGQGAILVLPFALGFWAMGPACVALAIVAMRHGRWQSWVLMTMSAIPYAIYFYAASSMPNR